MLAFIELTDAESGVTKLININNVTEVIDHEDFTTFYFIGDNNTVSVREKYAEVHSRIAKLLTGD